MGIDHCLQAVGTDPNAALRVSQQEQSEQQERQQRVSGVRVHIFQTEVPPKVSDGGGLPLPGAGRHRFSIEVPVWKMAGSAPGRAYL